MTASIENVKKLIDERITAWQVLEQIQEARRILNNIPINDKEMDEVKRILAEKDNEYSNKYSNAGWDLDIELSKIDKGQNTEGQ